MIIILSSLMSKDPTMVLCLLFLCFIGGAVGENWQAAGSNMSDYFPYIWSNIEDNIGSFITGPSRDHSAFAKNLSDTYNNKWDPAWNVFVIEDHLKNQDSVVVGYAFRDHWLWFNGYDHNGRTLNFIIWKDYNCKVWNTLNYNQANPQAAANQDQMFSLVNMAKQSLQKSTTYFAEPQKDIWKASSTMVNAFKETIPALSFTILAFQSGTSLDNVSVNGRFCSAGGANSYASFQMNPNGAINKVLGLFILMAQTQ